MAERRELFITFGVQYAREPHPAGDWVHPDGFLVVEYPVGRDGWQASRERARLAAWSWLDGQFAFDYSLDPNGVDRDVVWYPRGELARIVLP